MFLSGKVLFNTTHTIPSLTLIHFDTGLLDSGVFPNRERIMSKPRKRARTDTSGEGSSSGFSLSRISHMASGMEKDRAQERTRRVQQVRDERNAQLERFLQSTLAMLKGQPSPPGSSVELEARLGVMGGRAFRPGVKQTDYNRALSAAKSRHRGEIVKTEEIVLFYDSQPYRQHVVGGKATWEKKDKVNQVGVGGWV
jgi:hypothetical protein